MDNRLDADEQTELPYQVRIENFEGPLDLLLHLIKKSEINIYDIPINPIAQQYLTYIEAMEELNLTVAGEFLVMAATLLQIKSKMLLPADETVTDEEDGPDPREELVRRLLEYKQFKKRLGNWTNMNGYGGRLTVERRAQQSNWNRMKRCWTMSACSNWWMCCREFSIGIPARSSWRSSLTM